MERDNIPVDIAVHRLVNGEAEPYYEGEDPVALPHEVQALPGNKFTARVLRESGTYYIRVEANHPEFKLRTRRIRPPALFGSAPGGTNGGGLHHGRRRLLARQHSAPRRYLRSRFQRPPGNIPMRGLPSDPLLTTSAALCR